MTNVTFDSYDLQDSTYITSTIDGIDSSPEQIIESYKLARTDGNKLVDTMYAPKVIKLEGVIISDTQSNLEIKIDEFKEVISRKEKYLIVDWAGSTRKYLCTAKNHIITRSSGSVTRAAFSVEFEASNPFGYAPSATNTNFAGVTTSPYTNTIIIIGSADPEPVYTITVNSATSFTALSFYTAAEGDTITITHALVASDVLIIDTANKTVTLNGVAEDYTGIFPSMIPGSNSFTITTTATGRNYDLNITYTARYK